MSDQAMVDLFLEDRAAYPYIGSKYGTDPDVKRPCLHNVPSLSPSVTRFRSRLSVDARRTVENPSSFSSQKTSSSPAPFRKYGECVETKTWPPRLA